MINNPRDNRYLAAFNKYHQELIALPVNLVYLTFVAKGLFNDSSLNMQFLSATTDINKMTLLLTSMKEGLRIDVFQRFLEAIQEYAQKNKDPVVKKLVIEISQELLVDSPSTSSPPSGMLARFYPQIDS